jgi:hypothetical protein
LIEDEAVVIVKDVEDAKDVVDISLVGVVDNPTSADTGGVVSDAEEVVATVDVEIVEIVVALEGVDTVASDELELVARSDEVEDGEDVKAAA